MLAAESAYEKKMSAVVNSSLSSVVISSVSSAGDAPSCVRNELEVNGLIKFRHDNTRRLRLQQPSDRSMSACLRTVAVKGWVSLIVFGPAEASCIVIQVAPHSETDWLMMTCGRYSIISHAILLTTGHAGYLLINKKNTRSSDEIDSIFLFDWKQHGRW